MSAPDSAAASDPMRCGYSDTADNRSSEGTTSVLIEIHPTVVNDNYLSATRNHSSRHTMSLSANQATALLLADCLGTGLLALPNDIRVLGSLVGLGFLILNLPINYFAGYILHETAMAVEQQQNEAETHRALLSFSSINGMLQQYNYQTIRSHPDTKISPISNPSNKFSVGSTSISTQPSPIVNQNNKNNDTATFDFIGMTTALFTDNPSATFTVTCMYYCNIFLVLGNYILVMSYAVVAAFGETNVDILTAGGLSAMGMFAVSQTRTMARLGRSASFVSLTALLVVILQCLWEVRQEQRRFPIVPPAILSTEPTSVPNSESPFMQQLRKLSALGSIGFAVGSQKLFLNIRHELADRNDAPRTLAGGLTAFGTLYVLSCLVAGPHPPSFLFDAIPTSSWNRHFAGALLWIHVVVSYAINSQAICSSMDRLLGQQQQQVQPWTESSSSSIQTPTVARTTLSSFFKNAPPAVRWMVLSGTMAATSFTVANAIPFFTDLVGLIGAITSVPLTLLLPAIFWRKHLHVPLWVPTVHSLSSAALVYFSLAFMVAATIGSLYSIRQDWVEH